MTVVLIILSVLFWLAGLVCLFRRQLLGPAFGYLGLLTLSFARQDGVPLLPISSTMLWAWLAMTIAVMVAVMLQPAQVSRGSHGEGYMLGGAVTGLAVGLLGFTATADISLLYGIMIVAVAAGVFLGFLLYSRTPHGSAYGVQSGRFFSYLLAKGFPTAITVMQIGVALVLTVALYTLVNP